MCLPDVLLVRIGLSALTGSEYLVVLAGVPLYLFAPTAGFGAEEEDDEVELDVALFCEAIEEAAEEPGIDGAGTPPPLGTGVRLMRLALSVAGTLDLA